MPPSLLPEAMHDSARTSRLALVGVFVVLSALLGIATPTPAAAQSSASSCGGPEVYFFDSEYHCNEALPAFCPEPVAAGEVYDANSVGQEACCAAEKEYLGSCSAECAEQMYDFCAVVCCFPGEEDGYIAYGQCAPGEDEVDPEVNDFGEIDVPLSCGYEDTSTTSSSSEDEEECGNGVVDDDEECDDGSWCVGGDYDGYPIYTPEDADDCYDGGGEIYKEGGYGCDTYCNLEDIYCCNVDGYREAVDYETMLDFAEGNAGDYLTGYYCAGVDASIYPPGDSNLTTTNPDESCFCGDGEVQPDLYEECDMGDGYNDDANGCPDCVVACGDGYLDESAAVVDWGGTSLAYDSQTQETLYEQCDDGNWTAGDGCDAFCQREPIYYCVSDSQGGYREEVDSGVRPEVDVGYECQGASDPYIPGCFGTVTAGQYDSCECGDGVVQYQEDCDLGADYNTLENGCASDCTYVCGDDVINSDSYVVNAAGDDWLMSNDDYLMEQCDDGNWNNNDGCDENCQVEPGLCCFAPTDWADYGYYAFEEDELTEEKVDNTYCDYYGGTYYDPDFLSTYRSSGGFYELCEVPGICCSDLDGSYESLSADGCYGTFLTPESLELGDYYGDSYDADGDGTYNSEEASYACQEVGVCCYDVDQDGTNDTYDISTEDFDVDAGFCQTYGGEFIPLSSMEDPYAPGEECGVPGICCYTDYTYASTTQVDCDSYGEYVYDPIQEDYIWVEGDYVSFDEANTDGDYFLSEDEEIAACDARGICCYDDDGDGYFDTYDTEVSQGYCENEDWNGFYAPMGVLDGQSPSEFCGIPGVCCYDNSAYYSGSDPDRQSEENCGYYDGEYHTYEEATTPPNGNNDYELDYQEMQNVCNPLGLCCHDIDGDQNNDTYYEDMDSAECAELYQGDWISNSALSGQMQYPTPADYCRIPAVCCPTGESDFTEPYYAQRYECTGARGNYVDFDTANTDGNDVIDSQELEYACEEPGYCCNPYDYQYDEVYGADDCETPEEFRPSAEAWDLNDDDYIEWGEACAQYCCYANSYDEYGPYDLEPTNLAADYPDVYALVGDDCQAATGDISTLGYVSDSDEDVCAVYCCSEDVDGNREAYEVDLDDQYTACAELYDDNFEPMRGGDYIGYPTFDEASACDYDEPVVCCTANGEEVTLYENELGEGDMCDEWLNEIDCYDIEWRDSDYCYQAMAAVPASDRQSSSQSSLEPLCQLYCCSGGEAYGDPNLDPNMPCEDQEDSMGYQLYGGYEDYPTYDEYYACPTVPTYCCQGGTEVVEAIDSYGNPLRDSYGNPIKPGDNCADFGAYEPFPGHDEYTSDYACDYYCCDADTEEQVAVVAEDYAEAEGIYGAYPSCEEIAELTSSNFLDGPLGTPESCSNPTLYCCEAASGSGPSGVAVPAYENGEDVSSGVNSNGDVISNGCYEPNTTRSYSDGDMTCCQGDAAACSSFCTDISIFFGWVTVTACNPQVCAAAGCMPDLQDQSGVADFLLSLTNNPWYGGVACDTCQAGAPPDDDTTLYACDHSGGSFTIDPEEYGYYLDEYVTDDADEAALACSIVYLDEYCSYPEILANAMKYKYAFFTESYCSSL